ncbi:MAG: RHS repeat-associated core domain-containing protein, partial [Myxococcales bacterium]|nr:RHS repeat-associated core domain-containing protein [Myxococcales bacterium]
TRSTRYTYDDRGYLGSVTADSSATESLQTLLPQNDPMGFPEEVTVTGISTTLQSVDVDGATSGITPPGKPQHGMTYDVLGQLTEYRPPLHDAGAPAGTCPDGAECYSYNLDRQLEDVTLADGTVVDYSYGASTGLLDSVVVPDFGTVNYGYTTAGRLSTITSTGHGTLTYKTQGDLPISEARTGTLTAGAWSGTLNGTVERYWNSFLELDRLRVVGGFDAKVLRDNDGLVTSIEDADSLTSHPTFVITRSALDGHIASTDLGVVETEQYFDIDAGNPGFGDLTGLVARANSNNVFQTSYIRDRLGRISELVETVEGTTKVRKYTYDGAGRLTEVRDGMDALVGEYAYDGNGNRTKAHDAFSYVDLGVNLGCPGGTGTEAADAEDRLCTYGNWDYLYDDNGALVSKTNTVTSDVETFEYDGLGRLLSATVSGQTIEYAHDARGRRIGRVVNGTLDKGWLYADALNPIAQFDSTGALEATFVYGTRGNVPDYIVQADGDVYRVIADHLGSVRLIIDVTTGMVAHRMDYDAWGNVTYEAGDSSLHPFGFAGGIYDRGTGLVRFGARDYDSVTGRWTGKDPIKFSGGMNFYSYVGNEPVLRRDPSGLAWLYYWDPGGTGTDKWYGHVSLQLDDGTYISQWPNRPLEGPLDETGNQLHGGLLADIDGEGGRLPHRVLIDDLDEQAISDWWRKRHHDNFSVFNNCSDVVSEALREGGKDIPWHAIYHPDQVYDDVMSSRRNSRGLP